MLRAVVFDMDDTLLDWSHRLDDWDELSRQHLRPVSDYLANEGHVVSDIDMFAAVFSYHARVQWDAVKPPEWIAPRQIDMLRNTLAEMGIDVDKVDMEEAQKRFAWGVIPGVKLFDDTIEVLDTLHRNGIMIGLLTNAAHPMWMRDRELEALGIIGYFSVRYTASDAGRTKPHPEPFQKVMRDLGVEPHEAIYVGDRMQDDVIGSQAAGMRAVWLRRSPRPLYDGIKPNAICSSLREILSVFDIWFPTWREASSR